VNESGGDPKALIFRVAKNGIVGDLFEVIPPIIKKAKELNVWAGYKPGARNNS
jgi:electron transfer flavoprotein alpha subunit